MNDLVQGLLEKARGRLETAQYNLEADAYDDAISRAYYAAFHAANAALYSKGKTAKT